MRRFFYISILLMLLSSPSKAYGKVIFYDDVVIKGTPIMLKAETRGRFFPRGGQMVDFFANERSIGKNLSGGDGVAMKEFIPQKRGLYKIHVESGGEGDDGYLLSLNKGEGIVFIDVEGGLFDNPFSMRPRKDSRKAIMNISKRLPIVYLKTGMLNREILKEWLKEKGFQKAPVLEWEDGGVFDMIYGKGLKVMAIIGSPSVIGSLRDKEFKAFSFEETEGAEWVKDWKQIERGLR